jgi:hypothetical protein
MDRVGRVVYMNLYLADAVRDQLPVEPNALFERFVGWARVY